MFKKTCFTLVKLTLLIVGALALSTELSVAEQPAKRAKVSAESSKADVARARATLKRGVASVNASEKDRKALLAAVKSKNVAEIGRIFKRHGFDTGPGGTWQVNGFCSCTHYWNGTYHPNDEICACANGDVFNTRE